MRGASRGRRLCCLHTSRPRVGGDGPCGSDGDFERSWQADKLCLPLALTYAKPFSPTEKLLPSKTFDLLTSQTFLGTACGIVCAPAPLCVRQHPCVPHQRGKGVGHHLLPMMTVAGNLHQMTPLPCPYLKYQVGSRTNCFVATAGALVTWCCCCSPADGGRGHAQP